MTQAKHTILIVDDDLRLRALLEEFLRGQNFNVVSAEDASTAKAALTSTQHAIGAAIFDVMMPGDSGLDLLAWLRSDAPLHVQSLPVIMLTALGETDHRIEGLRKGADDYMAKPFEPEELVLRLRNLIKPRPQSNSANTVTFGPYAFDTVQQTLTKNNAPVTLTTNDRDLLAVFVAHIGSPLQREELAKHMGVSLSPRTIDVQIARLRQKIEDDPKNPIYLVTERHKGYALKS